MEFLSELQGPLEPAGAEVGQCGPEIMKFRPVPSLHEVGALLGEHGQTGEVDLGVRRAVAGGGDLEGDGEMQFRPVSLEHGLGDLSAPIGPACGPEQGRVLLRQDVVFVRSAPRGPIELLRGFAPQAHLREAIPAVDRVVPEPQDQGMRSRSLAHLDQDGIPPGAERYGDTVERPRRVSGLVCFVDQPPIEPHPHPIVAADQQGRGPLVGRLDVGQGIRRDVIGLEHRPEIDAAMRARLDRAPAQRGGAVGGRDRVARDRRPSPAGRGSTGLSG